MISTTIRVRGLAECRRAFKAMDAGVSKGIDVELKGIGEIVASDARGRFSGIDARTAGGFKPRLRGFAHVEVAQTIGSKGLRGDYGALQMRRGLLPALAGKEELIVAALDSMIGRLAGINGF
jgi:hypothetical protein